jgi:EAL domain-containing protein (putative c-di-GMP-specific phosphodiesterase class I)
VSGLPTREPLFASIATSPSGVLGVIHLLDLERLQAFDEALADHVLVALAERVVRMLGTGALVAQVDRARLAVWFGPETPAELAGTKLQALGYALGEAVSFGEREVLPEIRVSHAHMAEHGTAPAALLVRASVSRSGTADAFASVADDPLTAAQQLYTLEQDLRRAVARGELELAYQPLVDVQAGAVCGAEALLRWRHPDHGLVPPTRFVPIMEAAGLADEIGLWAINAACREAATWRRLGLGPLRVAVNISGHQLDRGDFATLVERTLARHSLSSDLLEIELTETIAAGESDRVAALFGRLRRLGVAIAIDDFGTGYSSFSTLRTLRFDKLKIDREFVTAVDRRRDSQAICRAILELGRGLGIRVLAEGVETAAEYSWLNAQGCRHFQGYYFARPLDPAAFRAFVQDEHRLAGLLAPISDPVSERLRA